MNDNKAEETLKGLIKHTSKLLELEDEEVEILRSAIWIATSVGANRTGEKMNKQLEKEMGRARRYED